MTVSATAAPIVSSSPPRGRDLRLRVFMNAPLELAMVFGSISAVSPPNGQPHDARNVQLVSLAGPTSKQKMDCGQTLPRERRQRQLNDRKSQHK
jgi:hypothetical protein